MEQGQIIGWPIGNTENTARWSQKSISRTAWLLWRKVQQAAAKTEARWIVWKQRNQTKTEKMGPIIW